MRIPSRYFVSHRAPASAWLKFGAQRLYHAVPDRFVTPYRSRVDHFFICGCGHSGTTLLASKLGQHSKTMLIGRETRIFEGSTSAHCARRIIEEWDYFASIGKKQAVLEKTPKHVHYISKIKRIIPDSKIILIHRNPLDNISSLHKRFNNLSDCINRWTSDNKSLLDFKGKENVHSVGYEDLVSNPRENFVKIMNFMGFDWEDHILDEGQSDYSEANRKGTMAMRADQVSKAISRNIGGWKSTFSTEQAEMILQRTKSVAVPLNYPTDINGYSDIF